MWAVRHQVWVLSRSTGVRFSIFSPEEIKGGPETPPDPVWVTVSSAPLCVSTVPLMVLRIPLVVVSGPYS